jgi:hypothetical protein
VTGVLALSPRDSARFRAALDDDTAAPNDALTRAAERYAMSVVSESEQRPDHCLACGRPIDGESVAGGDGPYCPEPCARERVFGPTSSMLPGYQSRFIALRLNEPEPTD